MALTNAQVKEILSAAGVSGEALTTAATKIIEGHLTSINVLREENTKFKGDAEKLADVQKELNDAKRKLQVFEAKGTEETVLKKDYDEVVKQVEDYKAKEVKAEKTKSVKDYYLNVVKIKPDKIDAVMKVTDLNEFELDENKKVKGSDKRVTGDQEYWSEFVEKITPAGTQTPNPPANTGKGKKTVAEIEAITDRDERRQAIAENIELFN